MTIEGIRAGLEQYKRKFYYKKLSKGLLLALSVFLGLFILLNILESFFWFNSSVRFVFLLTLIISFLAPIFSLVLLPLFELFKLRKGITDKQIALEIGKYFPQVDDKLLNLLELNQLSHNESSLIAASIRQKEESLKIIDFSSAIDLRVNLKYLYLFLIVITGLGLLSFINPILISGGTTRIIQFQDDFEKPMPFQIAISNEMLRAYKNEDFELEVKISGETIPQNIYLVLENKRRIKLLSADNQTYRYTFANIQIPTSFNIQGAGYISKDYKINLINRPEITDFTLKLNYPTYINRTDEQFKNIGNATIPEGTEVSWALKTMDTDKAEIIIDKSRFPFQHVENEVFTFNRRIFESQEYAIDMINQFGKNKTPIAYTLDVIKDQFPEIDVRFINDTIRFSSIIVAGKINDDYGFSQLRLFQKPLPDGKTTSVPLKINRGLPTQNFVHRWDGDSTMFAEHESVEIWVEVWDNDGVNGAKKTTSSKYFFKKPNEEEIEKIISENSNQTESELKKAEKESKKLNDQLEELEDRLKNKTEIGWQEEKLIQDIISRKEEIQKSIEEIQKKHEELIASQEQFDKQSEKLAEKSQQLQKLMEELLDDETKALYNELQKLLEEKSSLDEVNKQLAKIKPSENNLEKELERAIELFKKLKLETKIEETANKLEKLGEQQEMLGEENEKNQKESNQEESLEEQEKINTAFEDVKEDVKEIEELNQDMKNPEPLEDFHDDEKEIQEDLDDLTEELKTKPSKNTPTKQKNTGKQMKQMAGKMAEMQNNMEMEMMEENLEQLRDILDNLIKTSFEQERIIQDFSSVSQSDPRFLELSQDQLRLIDNSKVIEDSLLSLASRVLQISNFVTREINQINRSLESALDAIKERQKPQATSHQQFAMTSMNNLALLLDDVIQQMQMAMSKPGGSSGSKKGKKPSMSQLQQQLSQQIQDLKKSGKSGRPLSEELARMAAEQARIREQMEEMQQKLEGQNENGTQNGNGLKEAIEKMEQNEVDLVNKRLTQNLINRQEEIITRMLEAEKSMREQEQDPERKGETASQIKRKYPPAFEEYLKARESEIELLNSIPLDLNPFYKKEVNDYFRRLSVQDK